jgi:nickel-dependent lactate racemase
MKRLEVPYGDKILQIEIDDKYLLDIISMHGSPSGNADKILTDAIKNPLEGKSLIDFIGHAGSVNIIVNDAARATRTGLVLSAIHRFIEGRDINFLVATGAHRAPSRQELMKIFGNQYDAYKEKITIHEARDDSQLDHIGKTRYGNDIWLNRLIARTNKTLIIGSIEPHYFAGYTGDRKALLPGVAGYRTIEKNHKLALHANAKPLKLDGNPIHEEMLDCTAAVGAERLYSIQMVLDRKQNVHLAYTGPIVRTLEIATNAIRRLFVAKIGTRAEIVVTVAQYPFDIDLYQTLKAIEHGRQALAPGGILIVVSPCPRGLGPKSFARLFETVDSIDAAAHQAKSNYRLGDHNAHNLMTLRNQGDIWAVTEIDESTLRTAKISKFQTLQIALDQAIRQKARERSVLFLLNGSMTVPEIT